MMDPGNVKCVKECRQHFVTCYEKKFRHLDLLPICRKMSVFIRCLWMAVLHFSLHIENICGKLQIPV